MKTFLSGFLTFLLLSSSLQLAAEPQNQPYVGDELPSVDVLSKSTGENLRIFGRIKKGDCYEVHYLIPPYNGSPRLGAYTFCRLDNKRWTYYPANGGGTGFVIQ